MPSSKVDTNVRWTPAATLEEALDRAALEYRVESEYTDNWGEVRRAKPEVRAAVLRALGVRWTRWRI